MSLLMPAAEMLGTYLGRHGLSLLSRHAPRLGRLAVKAMPHLKSVGRTAVQALESYLFDSVFNKFGKNVNNQTSTINTNVPVGASPGEVYKATQIKQLSDSTTSGAASSGGINTGGSGAPQVLNSGVGYLY